MSDIFWQGFGYGAAFTALAGFGLWFSPKFDRMTGIKPKDWRW